MFYISLSLLYFSQLVYTGNRWTIETTDLVEAARMARLRKALDWTDKPQVPEVRYVLRR